MRRFGNLLRSTVAILLPLLLGACGGEEPGEEGGRRPNVLFLFTDDHASHAISAYGSLVNETPHLDRLAREGMRFDRCFCTNSICAPSRAVVLTGVHSHVNGQITNAERFDGSQPTLPKLLRAAGYQTALIGKWHLKSDPTGFDHWEILHGQGPYYNPRLRSTNDDVRHEGYVTDVITDRAIAWLEKERDSTRPFLLMCQHKAPHRNWMPGPDHLDAFDDVDLPEPATLFDDYEGRAPGARTQLMTVERDLNAHDLKLEEQGDLTDAQRARWDEAYDPRNAAFKAAGLEGRALVRWKYQRYIKDYLRCVASVDDNVGRMLDHLDASGLAESTLVVYSSDQGFYLGDHGWYDKRWMYEESLRMPLLLRWPGVVRPGSVDRSLVQNLDFAPTLLETCGVAVPERMQGASFLPLLRGETPADWRRSVYYHYYEYPGWHAVPRHYGVRTDRYKLIRYYTLDAWELFDLEEDPREMRSVHDDPAYAAVRVELEAELAALRRAYAVPPDERSLEGPIPR